jgi:hypothetical protein
MKKLLLSATAILLASPLLLASGARASTMSIGLQEAGVNSGLITTVATSSGTGTVTLASTPYGTWTVNQANAQDETSLGLPNVLNSNALDISSTAAGILHVFVTSQGLTTPTGTVRFATSFAVNDLSRVASVLEQSFFDQGNGLYTTTQQIDSQLFTSIGTAVGPGITVSGVTAPYSVTHEYTLTHLFGTVGNDNVTIDLNAVPSRVVPEPASLLLLGGGLVGLGLMRRKRR